MPDKYKCNNCGETFNEKKTVTETYTVPEWPSPPSEGIAISASGFFPEPGEYTEEYEACPHCGGRSISEYYEGYISWEDYG
jgi:DNA-directed RNA polymerase subunit RPC12/RpoP